MIPTSTYYPAIYNIISNPLNYTINGVFVGVGGRVEYYKNKTWNQFCGKGFSSKNA